MIPEPRIESDYTPRQIEAAKRVLVDVGQVLASFRDCFVLIGGWVPDLLIEEPEEPHVGSIDVDLAIDARRLKADRYAEMLKLLIDTRRYRQGPKPFQLATEVDLGDSEQPVVVEVDFLAPAEARLQKSRPKRLPGFRVQQADCSTACRKPVEIEVEGQMVQGARNKLRVRVASLPDLLVLKAFAIEGRDKPKDAYDFCYTLDYYPGGMEGAAAVWKDRSGDKDVSKALAILKEKFQTVDSFGPRQVVEFHGSGDNDERKRQARRAFELVQRFMQLVEGSA